MLVCWLIGCTMPEPKTQAEETADSLLKAKDAQELGISHAEEERSGEGAVSQCFLTSALVAAMPDPNEGLLTPTELWLRSGTLDSLDICSRIGYAVHYPETFYQTCRAPEEDEVNTIYGVHPASIDDLEISQQQVQAIAKDREGAIECIHACMHNSGPIHHNLKQVILELDAYELIPDVRHAYRNGNSEDPHLLTLLVELMRKGKYVPFTTSVQGMQLEAVGTLRYRPNIPATEANINAILTLATAYHQWRTPH
jgi:hypothetical protein